MSATRTQVYLTAQQRDAIDRLAHARGVTMAEIIRNALDEYLQEEADPAAALATTFGASPDIVGPDRGEWDRG